LPEVVFPKVCSCILEGFGQLAGVPGCLSRRWPDEQDATDLDSHQPGPLLSQLLPLVQPTLLCTAIPSRTDDVRTWCDQQSGLRVPLEYVFGSGSCTGLVSVVRGTSWSTRLEHRMECPRLQGRSRLHVRQCGTSRWVCYGVSAPSGREQRYVSPFPTRENYTPDYCWVGNMSRRKRRCER
jgi:hypothetical protein